MTAFQVAGFVAIPVTVLLVAVVLIALALRGAVCFTMITVGASAGLAAGAAGYDLFQTPVSSSADRLRDFSMGLLLAYGGLVLVAGLIFRANVWAIRGNDAAPEDVAPAEMSDA